MYYNVSIKDKDRIYRYSSGKYKGVAIKSAIANQFYMIAASKLWFYSGWKCARITIE